MRSQLYMFASGLFAQPTRDHLKILRPVLDRLLLDTPEASWKDTLIALKQEMAYDEEWRQNIADCLYWVCLKFLHSHLVHFG